MDCVHVAGQRVGWTLTKTNVLVFVNMYNKVAKAPAGSKLAVIEAYISADCVNIKEQLSIKR